jgi:hypothetical protein
MAGGAGIEPATNDLTGRRSTAELPSITDWWAGKDSHLLTLGSGFTVRRSSLALPPALHSKRWPPLTIQPHAKPRIRLLSAESLGCREPPKLSQATVFKLNSVSAKTHSLA